METSIDSNAVGSWRGWVKPLVPPLLIDVYRRLRYGKTSEEQATPAITESREVQFTLPTRTLDELLPGINSTFVTTPAAELYRPRDMVVPVVELLTLAAICKHQQPRRVFEIGTYTGSSTLLMAINLPPESEIFTLDLEPLENIGSRYRNTEYSTRIRQLYGNSLKFDYTPFHGTIDMLLIDANHDYEHVKADTQRAFELLRPGGIIVWDDYRWLECHSECAGVTLFLNELQSTRPIFSIAGTRFAIYVDKQPNLGPAS